MKKLLPILALLIAPYASGQDFDKGLAAFENGDYETALEEWRPLAEQGDAAAQYNLGRMYYFGQGVMQVYGEAAKWFRLAAEQGHARAQIDLGGILRYGYGVPQDFIGAYMWWSLAALSGYDDASRKRDSLAELMTHTQLAQAQALTQINIPRYFKRWDG